MEGEFEHELEDWSGKTSKKVQSIFGITRHNKAAIRCGTYTDHEVKLSAMTHNLDGMEASIGPTNNLSVVLGLYMPICAPGAWPCTTSSTVALAQYQ